LPPERLHAMGIDRVILRVFQNDPGHGGLFFENSLFRVLSPVLERIGDTFAGSGVDLYAWMITRQFNWLGRSLLYDNEYHRGRLRTVDKLDLFNTEAVNQLTAVFGELAGKRIDGILIQDDLFLRHNEGFSLWGKAAFVDGTSWMVREEEIMERGSPQNRHWVRVKKRQIIRVLRQIVAKCRSVNPRLKIGMNIYYETPLFVRHAEEWYGHNLAEILETDIDYVYLMSYHRQMREEMKLSEVENRRLFARMMERARALCGDRMIPKLQIRDWRSGRLIPREEIDAYLQMIPDSVRRVCLTPVKPEDLSYIEAVIQADRRRTAARRNQNARRGS